MFFFVAHQLSIQGTFGSEWQGAEVSITDCEGSVQLIAPATILPTGKSVSFCLSPVGGFQFGISQGEPSSQLQWSLADGSGVRIMAGDGQSDARICHRADQAATLSMIDSFGDGWNGGVLSIRDCVDGHEIHSETLDVC